MVLRLSRVVRYVTVAALLFAASEASAQSVGERLIVLKVDFAAKAYWLENLDGSHVSSRGYQQGSSLKDTSEVFLAKRNLARLVIVKTNPLAYSYRSKAEPPVNTADFTAVSRFLEAISAFIKVVGGPVASTAGVAVTDEARTQAETDIEAILNAHGFDSLTALQTYIIELQEASETVATKARQMPDLFARSKVNQAEVKRTVCGTDPSCAWGLTDVAKIIDTRFGKLRALSAALRADPDTMFTTLPGSLSAVLADSKEIQQTLATAIKFAGLVGRIDEEVVLSDEAAYIASKDQPIVVTRKELLVFGEPGEKEVSYRFVFKPDSPVTYGFGGDLVYSFVRPSVFSAVKKGDQLVITETPGPQYVGTKVGAILSISPTRWVGTPFTPVAEIGINTKTDNAKDNTGFLLGVGFSPYGLFHFGGGVAFEQAPRLDGQKVGDVVESADAVKTKLEFKRGWYLHVSVIKKLGA